MQLKSTLIPTGSLLFGCFIFVGVKNLEMLMVRFLMNHHLKFYFQVLEKAVAVGADSSQYPSNWIFHSRENKPGKAFVDGLTSDSESHFQFIFTASMLFLRRGVLSSYCIFVLVRLRTSGKKRWRSR